MTRRASPSRTEAPGEVWIFQTLPGMWAGTATPAGRQRLGLFRRGGRLRFRREIQLAGLGPAVALGLEGRLLPDLEGVDRPAVGREEAVVVPEPEGLRLDPEPDPALDEVLPELQELGVADRIEPDLVEEPQQPGLALGEVGRLPVPVPHLAGPADELVAPGALHAVDAQVGAADADGVLRGPGPRRVVLGRDQPVPGIDRGRDRGPEVDVAQPEDQVAGPEDDFPDLVDRFKPVDPPDEFDVARAPRGVLPDELHVLADRQRASPRPPRRAAGGRSGSEPPSRRIPGSSALGGEERSINRSSGSVRVS